MPSCGIESHFICEVWHSSMALLPRLCAEHGLRSNIIQRWRMPAGAVERGSRTARQLCSTWGA